MRFALSLAADNRILSATFKKYASSSSILVNFLPEGNIADYKYIGGQYVYEPLERIDAENIPSQLDRIEAQIAYTAMMTDTLLEV